MKNLKYIFITLIAICFFAITPNIAHAATYSVDNEFIDQNLNNLRTYIQTNGSVNSSNNHVISFTYSSSTWTATGGIVYDESNSRFQFVSTTEYSSTKKSGMSMYIDMPRKNSADVEDIELLSSSDGYTAKTSIEPGTYTDSRNYSFSVVSRTSSFYTDSNIQKLSNANLDLSFTVWEILLNKHNMSLKNIGFTAMCTSHTFSDIVIQNATCRSTGLVKHRCSICGSYVMNATPKTAATIKLSKTKVSLKRKRSVRIYVSQLASGDYVKSWKSSKKKVATVNSSGKITAKKKGKAYITVTLASGKTAVVKVTVK